MSEQTQVKRSNKITVAFIGDGVAKATFYKTHEKLTEILSTDPMVITHGFVFPESIPATETTQAVEVTSQDKLKAFKEFMISNATVFGVFYDAVDRRDDANKFPSRYTEELLVEFGAKVVTAKLNELLPSVQKTVDKFVEAGSMAVDSVLYANVGIGNIQVDETYGNGSIKYASATFPVVIGISTSGAEVSTDVKVSLVSGQMKKPTEFGESAFTITGIKTRLIESGVLVEPVKPSKEENTEGEEATEATEGGEPTEKKVSRRRKSESTDTEATEPVEGGNEE